ncbi:ankyrin repeat domain-containing protein 61 isoform X1 [Stegastes partitus]|uniref:Ankyrin repeat domain 61 n=1 Tax=Stegastes partitus TaxID=144197 RepID=A0A3B5ANS6_9TELE|nr:PREDICTED: ankyrin repeat domain-containing protein 61 isoform X1 [Stegastes partitus]
MLDGHKTHTGKRGNSIKICSNEFYTAIMDEDLRRIEGLSKKYGNKCLIEKQGGASGDVFWKGFTILPLHLAASYRRVHSMQSLLSAGADIEMRDQLGRTPLHLVIIGWPRILTTWPKPDSKFQTAVMGMCRQAEDCVRLLCEHGVNINAEVEGESHQTALHLSVRYKALSAVQILASYGANVNAVDSSGMTPLHMAAGILHKDIVASLIRQGADINMGVQQSGNTPLHLAVIALATKSTKTLEDGISCIIELLESGAEPNAVNKAGTTPLQDACSMGNEELVDLLLRYGANINKLSKAGENCLFLFLNHLPNVRNSSLLLKLLSLTSPLTIYNQNGRLPSTLTQPCFVKQREQLLTVIQQPRRLHDICKSAIFLKHVHGRTEELKRVMPERLYDFVFNHWENTHNISFDTDSEQDVLNHVFDIIPS